MPYFNLSGCQANDKWADMMKKMKRGNGGGGKEKNFGSTRNWREGEEEKEEK